MKNRMTTAVASLLVASLGATAVAQGAQQVPSQQTPPAQQMPQQQTPPQQMPQQTPPEQMPPAASTATSNSGQANQSGSMSSSKVEHQIKRALTKDGVTATHVKVTFDNGTATLSGTVYSKQDIDKAKQAAMQVHGVTQVDVSGLHARRG